MLWESVEPQAAMRERFGFAGFEEAAGWVTAMLGKTWAVTALNCSRMVISDQNAIVWVGSDRGGLIVKWSRDQERFERLDASTRLLGQLASQGIPVAAPIPTVDDRTRVTLDGPMSALSVTVLPELLGDWLNVLDQEAVRAAGACLARLHAALGTIAHDGSPAFTGFPELVDDWLTHRDRGFAPEASERLRAKLSAAPVLEDVPQLVHNDFRAANLLTRQSSIIGVLDFDEVVVGHRVSDLARASVYLGTLFTGWGPTSAEVKRTLRAGYESVRPLGPDEAQWLEILVLWHGLMAIPSAHDTAGWADAL